MVRSKPGVEYPQNFLWSKPVIFRLPPYAAWRTIQYRVKNLCGLSLLCAEGGLIVIEHLNSFLVCTDDGTEFRVFVSRDRINTSSHKGLSSLPGLATLRLEDGCHVNCLDEDTFLIVETGERAKRKH